MEAYDLPRLLSEHDPAEEPYLEFLRVPSLSVGLYVLSAGAFDAQQPHTEDEVYHIVSGKGRIRVGAEDRAVEAGTVVFVEAGMDHRFYAIEEDLAVLVIFAPAENSRGLESRSER
jgi:mannose-6-phosphate isomerase-like protein (cupin superfamily)